MDWGSFAMGVVTGVATCLLMQLIAYGGLMLWAVSQLPHEDDYR